VRRSRGLSDRCWPISRERKVPETAKLVGSKGRLPMPQTIMRSSFKVKMSKVKVTRSITAETESVSYLRNAKTYELQNFYADGACYHLPAIKAYKVELFDTVSAEPGGHSIISLLRYATTTNVTAEDNNINRSRTGSQLVSMRSLPLVCDQVFDWIE